MQPWLLPILLSSGSLFSPVLTFSDLYTLSLHDALPISGRTSSQHGTGHASMSFLAPLSPAVSLSAMTMTRRMRFLDRKSTRLNSSHMSTSYAVFCLKKKSHQHRAQTTHSFR